MTTQLSENERTIAMCFLFPIFWPFIPFFLVWFACQGIRDAYLRRKYRRKKLSEQNHNSEETY